MAKHHIVESLKVGLVLDDSLDKTGGVQEYILSVGRWLSRQGHEVHYLVGATKRQDIPGVQSLSRNVKVKFNGNYMTIPLPANKRKLRAMLEREQYDVLHVQAPYSPWLAHRLIMAAPSTTAIVGTFHIVAYSRLVHLATRALAVWTRRSIQRFDQMISVSTAAESYAHETYGIRSVVIPNAIDYYRFHEAAPIVRDKALRIVFLGRLVERKGCRYLLEAFAQLIERREKLPDCKVVVCGKGQLEAELKEFVRAHKLTDRVEFVGYIDEADKPGYYASADIAVFPSTGGESFGIVLIEAMASGRAAVLAGNNSGYVTVMAPKPELLFTADDPSELADKLQWLLTDKAARQDMASWGMEYSRTFDVNTVGSAIVSEYTKALRKRPQL